MLWVRYGCLLMPMLGFLLAELPSPEAATASSDLERNRQLLHKWKSDPEHAARLQRDLRAFWALPRAQRQRLRQLDRAFHQLDDKSQKRLGKVAERYVLWLERLSEADRRRIDEARDGQERLRIIKEIRQRQWIERLPNPVRADLEKLPPGARSVQVARLQTQERQQRKIWQRPISAGGHPKQPARLNDLSPEARNFLDKQLVPHLSAEEKRQLEASPRGPEFARAVKELLLRHPVLPPLPHRTITRYEDLPDKARLEAGTKLSWERRVEQWQRLRKVEGKWPEWALTFHNLLTAQQRERMPPLGASRPGEFPAEIRKFIEGKLRSTVNKGEWRGLQSVEGKWPDYPQHLLKLAEKHKLEVPGMSLPGSHEW